MRRLLISCLALTAVLSLAVPTQAAGRYNPRPRLTAGNQNQGGFFSRLMELERRKNAALRSMFGRS